MRKAAPYGEWLVFGLLVGVLGFGGSADVAHAYDNSSLYVKAMTVDIRVDKDTSLEVEERLTVNFPNNYGKDVFQWYITKSYEIEGNKTRKTVKIGEVTNEKGVDYQYDENQSLDGNILSIRKKGGNYSGEENINIVYSVSKFIEEGSDYDLITWPVVIKEQKIPIVYANVYINSPFSDVADVSCYAGDVLSKQRMCLSEYDKNKARIYSTGEMGNGREFVYQFGARKNNTLEYPGKRDRFFGWIRNNIEVISIFATVVTLGLVTLIWLLRNKRITIKIRKRIE